MPEVKGTVDVDFPDTVLNSSWAMVLTHSRFSDKNAVGLEALRTWAKEQFSQDRQFLHPLNLPRRADNSTIVESFVNNLFGNQKSWLETQLSRFLGWRVAEFRDTGAYQSFRIDFYELFGVSAESATLLARYQNERAGSSLGALMGALFWSVFAVWVLFSYLAARQKQLHSPAQRFLSYVYFAMGFFYLIQACSTDNVSVLAAALLCCLFGAYIAKPLLIYKDSAGELSLSVLELSGRAVLVLFWITFSLIGIQIISWIRGSIFTEPDPITLLVCALTGNFVHDPVNAKRTIVEIIGVNWLLVTAWMAAYFKHGTRPSRELDSQLESLAKITIEAK